MNLQKICILILCVQKIVQSVEDYKKDIQYQNLEGIQFEKSFFPDNIKYVDQKRKEIFEDQISQSNQSQNNQIQDYKEQSAWQKVSESFLAYDKEITNKSIILDDLVDESFDQQPFKQTEPKQMNNLSYLSKGYSSYFAFPLENTVDPGFRNASIFQFEYYDNKTTSDQKYLVPDNIQDLTFTDCSFEVQTSIILGEKSLFKILMKDVLFDNQVKSGAFKSSPNFQKIIEQIKKEQVVFLSEIKCIVYQFAFNQINKQLFSKQFKNSTNLLKNNETDYQNFLENFGTQFISEIKFGSKYGVFQTLSIESYQKLLNDGVDVISAASRNIPGIKVNEQNLSLKEKDDIRKFKSELIEQQVFSVGSQPPIDSNVTQWVQSSIENPMPVEYTLQSIDFALEMLLRQFNFDTKKIILEQMQKYLPEYCKKFENKTIINCDLPSDDITFQRVRKNSCRFCSSCSDEFPVIGGQIPTNSPNANFAMQYGDKCSEPYALSGNSPVTLCCQKVIPKQKVGDCRLCLSADGEFVSKKDEEYHYIGVQQIDPLAGTLNQFNQNCKEELKSPQQLNNALFACKQQICQLCVTCGNEYPFERGMFLAFNLEPKRVNAQRGENCKFEKSKDGQTLHPTYYNTPAKFCCSS